MQIINKVTRRFFELPMAAKIFSGFLIIALVFSSLFVVSLYSPVIVDSNSDEYLKMFSKTQLISMYKAEENNKSLAHLNEERLVKNLSASNAKLSLEIQKNKELNAEIAKKKTQLSKQMNLEYFTCGKSQGGPVNKKDLVNACFAVLKVMVTEAYQSSGQFPSNLGALGYSSDLHKNKAIKKINFKPHGDIDLFLKPIFGKDKKITLSFGFNHDEQWTCRSNLDEKVLSKEYCEDY